MSLTNRFTKKLVPSAVGLLAITALTCVFAPAQAVQSAPVENLANVNFSTDIRIFSVMAALNAAGFDYETPGREMGAVRKMIREDLKRVDPKLLNRLRSFYEEHRENLDPTRQVAVYISLALLIGGPPDFSLGVDKKDVPEDVLQVLGFEELVRDLNAEINLPDLWQRYQSYYTAELAAYRPVLLDVIHQTLEYFRIPPRIVLDRQIIVIPDLFGPNRLVNARNLEKSYYIILGPAEQPVENRMQLQHEYLHFLLDPLIQKFGTPLLKYENLLNLAQLQPHIRSEYQNRYMMVVAESLVESLVLRMNAGPSAERDLVALYRRGLIFAPYFVRNLAAYEAEADRNLTIPTYLETLFAGINENVIRGDESQIVQLEAKFSQEDAVKSAAEREDQQSRLRASRLRTLLQEGQNLLREQQYDAAQAKLEELIRDDPENAQGYFYLAQIASRQKDHDRAYTLYKRADETKDAAPVVRAWSKLRMGNYLAFKGQFEEARACFNQVIGMGGDFDGARDQAQRALGELPPANK